MILVRGHETLAKELVLGMEQFKEPKKKIYIMILSKQRILLTISLLSASILGAQNQVGQDLFGAEPYDNYGISISLNFDGSIIAVGTINSDANNLLRVGHVEVLEYINGSWVQIGEDIVGTNQFDVLGSIVALSNDGSRVAAVARDEYVRIFENVNGTWTQIGSDITGDRTNINFGRGMDISANADTIVISAPDYEIDAQQSGQVKVFYNNEGTWEQLGSDIYAPEFETFYGYTLQMSADGATIAIGARNEVKFYEFQEGSWVLTSSIAINAGRDASISMNPAGNVIAIGRSDVLVYSKGENDTWTQIGSNIELSPLTSLNDPDVDVDINDAGDIVVVGDPRDNEGADQAGRFHVYNLVQGEWVEDDQKILTGDEAYGKLGNAVSVSGNGNYYSVGTYSKDNGETPDAGLVRVYDMSGVTGLAYTPFANDGQLTVSPNPAEDVLTISLSEEHVLNNITMYNLQGQIVASSQTNQIQLNHLVPGVYLIVADTDQGRITQKVVKK